MFSPGAQFPPQLSLNQYIKFPLPPMGVLAPRLRTLDVVAHPIIGTCLYVYFKLFFRKKENRFKTFIR